jgi:hypothetical protein
VRSQKTFRLARTILSKMNRKAARDVAKKRGEGPYMSFENEAVRYVHLYHDWTSCQYEENKPFGIP